MSKFEKMLERRVVRKCAGALLNAGYLLGVYDGEETTLRRSGDLRAVMAALGTTDEDWLIVYDPRKAEPGKTAPRAGWVRLIYGNEPCYVINDNTVNLEHVIGDGTEFKKWLDKTEEMFG